MSIFKSTRVFSLINFLVPTFLFTSYVLNQYYNQGTVLLDVGWFTYLITEGVSWPLSNPPSLEVIEKIGDTFFRTHFSPFFIVLSIVHQYILFFIPSPIYFSIFIGSMYGLISLATFLAGLEFIPVNIKNKYLYLFALSLVSITTSMNGASLALIGFPHIEIAIPALILLFFSLYYTKHFFSSTIVFIFLLMIREDAGFHFFTLSSLVILSSVIVHNKISAIDKKLVGYSIFALMYSLLAVYIQKLYFPGTINMLEHVYIGNPHFTHVTHDFWQQRFNFLVENRTYLWVPSIFVIILTIYTRNIFLICGLLAIVPWILLSIFAITDMPHNLSNYYAFPFITMLSWPIVAFMIAKKHRQTKIISTKNILLSLFLVTAMSIYLFSENKGNFDPKPWKYFIFNDFKSIQKTQKFVDFFEKNKNKFGDILFDEACAALFVKSMQLDEYRYINKFNISEKCDTIIFYNTDDRLTKSPLTDIQRIIIDNKLNNIYSVKNTKIIIATKKSIKQDDYFILKKMKDLKLK